MNSKDMDKQLNVVNGNMNEQPKLNVCHGIVIHNLPENMKWDAVKSLEETFLILPTSVLSVTINHFGVSVVFDRYAPFFKAITKRIVVVNSVKYHIYPMVTDLTVIGAGPFLDVRTLKSLMSNVAPVLSVYREEDHKGGLTNNYRVIMNHPEIYEFIKLWPMDNFQIPGNALLFPITFFCRLCRQNGHTRHQCNETQQISCSDEKSYKLKFQEKRTKSHEDFKHSPNRKTERESNVRVESFEEILNVPFHCDESIENKQKDKSLPLREVKVPQPTLFKIKDEKFGTKPLQLKREDTDQPEINRCSNSAFTNGKHNKSASQRNKSDSTRSRVFKTPSTTVDSHKNVPTKCKKTKKNQNVRYSKLIPPELHIIVSPLKELFLNIVNETFSETIYTKAELYPYGVNVLLYHMKNVVQFNLKEISTRTPQERRHIFWIDSMLTKITEEHSKNNLEEDYLCSTSNLKLESYNTNQDRAYLSKCNMVTNDLKSETLKKNYFKEDTKVFTEQKDMNAHIKAKMNLHDNFQNKDTLIDFQKKKDKFSKNIKQIRQDVSLESMIKNIKLKLKKDNEHYSSESILNKKKHTNHVRRNKKHCSIRDVCGDGIQVTNLDLQKNPISCTMNEVCNKKNVPYLKDQIDVQNQKCCAVQRVSAEKISTYTKIKMNAHNDNIRCSMKELCVEKGVQYPGAKIDVQKNQKSCAVERVAEEKCNAYSTINMDEHNDKIRCSMNEFCVGKDVQYPGMKIDVLKNQKSCAVKRVAKEKTNTYPAINMNEHNDKIRCCMKEVCIGKDVQYPGVKVDVLKNQKSCDVKRVAKEKMNTYPSINMDGHDGEIRCSMKEFCVGKDVQYPEVKINVLKNQKSCVVKRVAEKNIITHPAINKDGHNEINSSMKELSVVTNVQHPGVKIDFLKNQQSCAVKRVAEEKLNTYSVINMDEHNDNIRCFMKEFFVAKGVQYPGAKMDVQKNQKMDINDDKREVFIGQKTLYQATKMDVQKDSFSATSSKTGHKKQPKNGKLYGKYSPGLLTAIRCSKGILKPSELKMFLIHVKGKVHVRQMAKNYSLEVNKLVEQLQVIVSKHYRGLRVIAPTSKEISWIKELIERLKTHENCEKCQK